jgi:DNA uptake protein ComE-like DNA-binding protein
MLRTLLNRIQDFFGISPKESRGALVLIILSFCLLWTPTLFKRVILPYFQDDTLPYTLEQLDSTAALISNGPPNETPEFSDKITTSIPTRQTRLVTFDPNTATIDQLQGVGIPRFLAFRIQNYRNKGGKFRKKEDLGKIYDFPPALYERLSPYVTLPDGNTVASTSPSSTVKEVRAPLPAEIKAFGKPTIAPFDINTSDTSQLASLRGIGSKLSARIVKFRDGLGGFHSINQYSEVFGLDSLALSELRRYARIQSAPRKININSASADDLYRHTYLKNRKLNEVIIRYREQHGPFTSTESMKAIRILDETTLRKITPYLAF